MELKSCADLPNYTVLSSEHLNDRPPGTVIDTIVIHSMYNLFPEFGEPFCAKACKLVLDQDQVSAHYLIDRSGHVFECVAPEKRAWHAGISKMPDGRENANNFSIGIELLADKQSGFTAEQYQSLPKLCSALCSQFPLRLIVSHQTIAPDRKDDPWGFDWSRLMKDLALLSSNLTLMARS